MARYPGAIYKPITAGKGRRRLTVYNRVNLHVAVSEAPSLHSYFNQTGIPDSHFYVRRDGTIEQYVDTAMRAFADLDGNDATISIETQGGGRGAWTAAQLEALAKLFAWAHRTHGIPLKLASTSFPGSSSSRGMSWHRIGIDGNFPSLPSILAGRLQRGGGMHYSRSAGKECPGPDRIPQIPGILARAKQLAGDAATADEEEEIDMAAKEEILHALEVHHEGIAAILRRVDPQSKEAADESRWAASRVGGQWTDEPLTHVLRRIEERLERLESALADDPPAES